MIGLLGVGRQDPAYSAYLGDLAKLGFFASGVHQAVFTLMSTLPYAVGQVQASPFTSCVYQRRSLAWLDLRKVTFGLPSDLTVPCRMSGCCFAATWQPPSQQSGLQQEQARQRSWAQR